MPTLRAHTFLPRLNLLAEFRTSHQNLLTMETTPEPILEPCPSCGELLDVSNFEPLTETTCPTCSAPIIVRSRFNNFTLLSLIARGGMGLVFKAIDSQLNREVALKILRREISGDAEQREKLAIEARLTASINHPHVVKVYSFGEDRGQFYIAMELVEKGSLDDLIMLQKRVAEIQILNVGIQIASGLQAALEVGLIHRDIKPGNILFSNARTSKLVDFGLALVADEAAAQKGEIWGTPYYIAPEKLDHQPEDFRSDIYSLGGTLFHALAGRPPYEAETASMVALKQLKSQPVSLQAFAPDVSSETAYVINRMMNKNPDERYQSYEELIQHLTYARDKLLARVRAPERRKPKPLQLESREEKNFMGMITLVLVFVVLIVLGVGFWQWPRISSLLGISVTDAHSEDTTRNLAKALADARLLAVSGKPKEALERIEMLLKSPTLPQPEKNWALLHGALFAYMGGNASLATPYLNQIYSIGILPREIMPLELSNFFVDAARLASNAKGISLRSVQAYKTNNYEAFVYYLAGMSSLAEGNLKGAREILEAALKSEPSGEAEWINSLRPAAESALSSIRELPLSSNSINAR